MIDPAADIAELRGQLETLAATIAQLSQPKRRKGGKPRRRVPSPTARQFAAVDAAQRHNSNLAAAARDLGITRQKMTSLCRRAVRNLYAAGLGDYNNFTADNAPTARRARRAKPRTRQYPRDLRGAVAV